MITAKNLSKANKYVRSVAFNGQRVTGFILKHADLMAGGELVFDMRSPNENTKATIFSPTSFPCATANSHWRCEHRLAPTCVLNENGW